MLIQLMYVLPMILGRTYDLRKNRIGVDIFPLEAVQSPQIVEGSFYHSRFATIETSRDVKEVLEIKGDLSLGIKAGLFAFRGAGSYIKESLSVQNSVDILTKVSFRTVSKLLPLSAKPIATWFSVGKEYLGTHFVRSILYGGDLIACIRFKAAKSEYLQDIRATIKASLGKGTALDLVGEGKLETLDKKLGSNATMEINYYATVPLEDVPNTIEGLRELVKNFEKHVQKENNGLGVPVEVELEELSSLNQGFTYLKNKDLDTELLFFEDYLDDLLTTKAKLKAWMSELPDILSEEQEKQISEFSERLSSVLTKFIDTIANLNLEKDASQLDEAKEEYKKGKGIARPGKFKKELVKLQKKIVLSNKAQDKGTTVYTHYGEFKCAEDEHTSTVFSGYLVSSPRNVKGAAYNYLCFPKLTRRSTQEKLVGDTSKIAGIKYGLLLSKPFQISDGSRVLRGVSCSVCLVKQRPNIHTFLGQNNCPAEGGWILQYSGFIMSSTDASRSEHICVDSAQKFYEESDSGYDDQSLSFVLTEQDNKNVFIPCAVCSK